MVRAMLLCGLAACSFRPGALRPGDAGGAIDAPSPTDVALDVATADAPMMIDASMPDSTSNVNGYEKPITVQQAMVAGDITGFPVWISLDGDQDLMHAQGDHSDVYFTDSTGAAIPYEITAWSQPQGTLQAWVRAPHLTPNPGTPNPNLIYLRFGGAAAPMASSGPAVFDNGYAAVWHLETATTTVTDASGHANGTISGTAPASTAGQLGQGLQFSAASSEITFTNPITGGGPSTISAWVYQAAISAGTYANTIMVLGSPATAKSRWFYSSYQGDASSVAAGLYGGGTNDETPSPAKLVTPLVWTKLDWVIGPAGASALYINGRQVDSKTLATPNTSAGTATIANASSSYSGGGSMAFVGVLDEIRISNTSRSASWLLTEYNNQSAPATFYTVGTAAAVP